MYRLVACTLALASGLDRGQLRSPEAALKAPDADLPLAAGRIRGADVVGGAGNRTRDARASIGTNISANASAGVGGGANRTRDVTKVIIETNVSVSASAGTNVSGNSSGNLSSGSGAGGSANASAEAFETMQRTNSSVNASANASFPAATSRKAKWMLEKSTFNTKKSRLDAYRKMVDSAVRENQRKQKENFVVNAEEEYDMELEAQIHKQELEKGRREALREQHKVLKDLEQLEQERLFTKEAAVLKGKAEGRSAREMAERLRVLEEEYRAKIAEKRKFGSEANVLAQEMRDAAMAENQILRVKAAAEAATQEEKTLVAEEAQIKEASEKAWRLAQKEDNVFQEVLDEADFKAKDLRTLQAQQENATKRERDLQAKVEAAAAAKDAAMQIMRKARRAKADNLIEVVENATEKVKDAELVKVKLEKATRRKDELTQLVSEARTAYLAAEKASAEAEVQRRRMAEKAAEEKRKEEEMKRKEEEAERVAQEKARKSEAEARKNKEAKRKLAVQRAMDDYERDEEYQQITEQRMVEASADDMEQEAMERRQEAREAERKLAKARQEKADAERRASRREDERLRREEEQYQKANGAAKVASQEAARQVREEAQRRAEELKAEAEDEARRASEKAQRKAKEEAERLVRVEKAKAEKLAKEEAVRAEREQRAKEAEEAKAREAARLKALEEAQLRKRAKAEQAKEAAERWAKQLADRRAAEEASRRAGAMEGLQRFLDSQDGATLRADFAPFAEVLNETNLTQWVSMLTALGKAMKDSSFEKNFTSAGKKLEESAARFATAVKELVANFMENSLGITGMQLVPILGQFFNETAVVLAEHLEDAAEFRSAIKQAVPQCIEPQGCEGPALGALGRDLEPMYALMAPVAPPPALLKPALETELLPGACGGLTSLLADVVSQDAAVGRMQRALNGTSRMVPMLNSVLPDLTPRVVTLVLDLAYVEAAALSEASGEVLAGVGPAISGRLQCTSASSGVSLGLGLLVPFLAMRLTWALA